MAVSIHSCPQVLVPILCRLGRHGSRALKSHMAVHRRTNRASSIHILTFTRDRKTTIITRTHRHASGALGCRRLCAHGACRASRWKSQIDRGCSRANREVKSIGRKLTLGDGAKTPANRNHLTQAAVQRKRADMARSVLGGTDANHVKRDAAFRLCSLVPRTCGCCIGAVAA